MAVLALTFLIPPSWTFAADPTPGDLETGLQGLDLGDRIKVETGNEVREGTYLGIEGAGLRMESVGRSEGIPAESIDIVWERNRRFWTGAFKGAVIGASGFNTLLRLVAVGLGEGDYSLGDFTLVVVIAGGMGALGGGLIGGGVGSLVKHWTPLYDPTGAGAARGPVGRTGSAGLGVSGGFLSEEGAPGGSVGFQGHYVAWGGRVLAFGSELAYQALGDDLGSLRGGAILVLSTPTRPFSVHGIAGLGSYFAKLQSTGGAERMYGGVGASLGGGVTYDLSPHHQLTVEVRQHMTGVDYRLGARWFEGHYLAVTGGVEFRW